MNCTNCIEAKAIPVCSGELLIGTVETEMSEVYVFVQNIATGYKAIHTVTPSEYDSSVSIPLDQPYTDFYSPNFYFKLWVSETEDGNEVLPVTIDEVEYECFTIIFQGIYSDDLAVKLDNVTLSV
jgi:hypothetical protein